MFWDILHPLLSFVRNYTVQMFSGAMLFCVHIGRRPFFIPKFAVALLVLGIECWLSDYDVIPNMDIWGWFNPSFLVVFFTLLLMMHYCFECDWRQTVFIGSVCWELQHLLASALRASDTFILPLIPEGRAWGCLVLALHLLFTAALFAAFHFVFIRRLLRSGGINGFANLRNTHLIVLSVVAIVIVYFISLGSAASGKDIWHLVYACSCCLLLFFLQFGIFVYGMDRKNEAMIKDLLDHEHEQHALSKQNMELLDRKLHDIKHEISDLRGLVTDKLLDGRLSEIQDSVRVYEAFVKTGNSALDVLLTEKLLYCEKYGIDLTCIADGRGMGFMEDEDIYSLLGNALDSAIESVGRADRRLRFIGLNIRTHGKMLVIHVDNYCADGDKMVFVDGLPRTTKPDSLYHGLGMLGIRYITEKYGGTMSVSVHDDLFVLNIVVPVPENGKSGEKKP